MCLCIWGVISNFGEISIFIIGLEPFIFIFVGVR